MYSKGCFHELPLFSLQYALRIEQLFDIFFVISQKKRVSFDCARDKLQPDLKGGAQKKIKKLLLTFLRLYSSILLLRILWLR